MQTDKIYVAGHRGMLGSAIRHLGQRPTPQTFLAPMNAAQLFELIAQGESACVEFKSSFQKEVIETLTAFANTTGGAASFRT